MARKKNQMLAANEYFCGFVQELIQQMANVQYTENLTEEQLDAMAGSDTLRYQATSFGVTRNNKVQNLCLRRFSKARHQ